MTEMFAYFTLKMEFFEFYKQDNQNMLQVFKLTPIRLEQSHPSDYIGPYCTTFYFDIKVIEAYSKHFENTKVCVGSLMEMVDAG